MGKKTEAAAHSSQMLCGITESEKISQNLQQSICAPPATLL